VHAGEVEHGEADSSRGVAFAGQAAAAAWRKATRLPSSGASKKACRWSSSTCGGRLQAHAVGDAGLKGPTADAVGRRHGSGSLNGPPHTNGPGSRNALAANNGLRSSNCHVSRSRRASVGRAGRTEKNASGHNGGSPHGKRERAHIASAGAIAATTERGPPSANAALHLWSGGTRSVASGGAQTVGHDHGGGCGRARQSLADRAFPSANARRHSRPRRSVALHQGAWPSIGGDAVAVRLVTLTARPSGALGVGRCRLTCVERRASLGVAA